MSNNEESLSTHFDSRGRHAPQLDLGDVGVGIEHADAFIDTYCQLWDEAEEQGKEAEDAFVRSLIRSLVSVHTLGTPAPL